MLHLLTGLLLLSSPSASAFTEAEVIVRPRSVVTLTLGQSVSATDRFFVPAQPDVPLESYMGESHPYVATVACVEKPAVLAKVEQKAKDKKWDAAKTARKLSEASRLTFDTADTVRIELAPGETVALDSVIYLCPPSSP